MRPRNQTTQWRGAHLRCCDPRSQEKAVCCEVSLPHSLHHRSLIAREMQNHREGRVKGRGTRKREGERKGAQDKQLYLRTGRAARPSWRDGIIAIGDIDDRQFPRGSNGMTRRCGTAAVRFLLLPLLAIGPTDGRSRCAIESVITPNRHAISRLSVRSCEVCTR